MVVSYLRTYVRTYLLMYHSIAKVILRMHIVSNYRTIIILLAFAAYVYSYKYTLYSIFWIVIFAISYIRREAKLASYCSSS